MIAAPAPAPWDWAASGKPSSSNGLFNIYITDANGRKIAAVWGKPDEKEATCKLIVAAHSMLAALIMVRDADDDTKEDGDAGIPPTARHAIDAAIAAAEGREP